MPDEIPDAAKSAPPRAGLIAVLVCAAAVRLLLPAAAAWHAGSPRVFQEIDSQTYLSAAESLARSGSFSDGGVPEILRTPGYPLLLVPGIWLGAPEWVTVLLQAGLGVLTTWLVWLLAKELFPAAGAGPPGRGSAAGEIARRVPLMAALIHALDPLSVIHCSLLLSETLFTALLALHLWWLLRFLGSGAWGHLVGAALAAAASAYVRPIACYLPLAEATVMLAAFLLSRRAARAALSPAPAAGPVRGAPSPLRILAFLALALAPLVPWVVRNEVLVGYPGFSAVVDQNLYYFQAAAVTAAVEGRPLAEVRARMRREARGWDAPEDSAAHYRALGAAGLRVLREHPFVYARIHLTGMVRLLIGPGTSAPQVLFSVSPERIAEPGGENPQPSWLLLPMGLILLVQLALAALGMAGRRWGAGLPAAVLLGAAAYLLFASGGALPYSRFRHPLMPVICVFAGWGWALLVEWHRGRQGPRAAAPAGRKFS